MFYICWGTKTFQKKEGIAADFCPICRRPSGVEVRQIRSQPHVYHIGIGQGEIVGRLCECLDCTSKWPLQTGTIQSLANDSISVSLQTLIAETYPRLSVVNAERLQQEAIIAHDPFALDSQTRLGLIAEPFFILENDVRREENQTISWEGIGAGIIGLGALLSALTTLVAFVSGEILWGICGLAVTVGLGWLALKLGDRRTRRFMRTSIYPRLASCLAPLNPTEEELTQVITHIQAKCASQTRLPDFLPLLQEARSQARPAMRTMPSPAMFDL